MTPATRIQNRMGSVHALTTTSPQSRIKSAFTIALICTTRRRILASASTNQGPKKMRFDAESGGGLGTRADKLVNFLTRVHLWRDQ